MQSKKNGHGESARGGRRVELFSCMIAGACGYVSKENLFELSELLKK